MPDQIDLARLDDVVARARAHALKTQTPRGSWEAACDQGPVATAQVIVGLKFVDRLAPADATDAARWLESRQRRDGSFAAHPYAEAGDPSATACAWAALRAAGISNDAESVRRARAFVEGQGGAPAVIDRMEQGDVSALFLAMARLVPAQSFPEPAHLFALIPPVEAWVERRFSVQVPFMLVQSALILQALRGERPLFERFERRQCITLLDRFQNADGSWLFGDTLHTVLGLATLRVIDVPSDDPRTTRALAWLEGQKRRDADGLWYSIFGSDVWTTAFMLRALRATGVSPGHEGLARATTWLTRARVAPGGGAPAGSGAWPFQTGNTTMPDCDDVGVVLGALGVSLDADVARPLPAEVAADVRAAIDAGTTWLAFMQDPGGGWASFERGLPSKRPGPMMSGPPPTPGSGLLAKLRFFLSPPPELGDPATEDVTGRVLHGLGKNTYTVDTPLVARALSFLQHQQCESGAFWGRWVVNYLAGTAWVLRGLASVGVMCDAPWVRRAVGFVVDKQNADGGWGEDVASYRSEAFAGVGASSPGLTGLVVSALIEQGLEASDAVTAGVGYLLREQRLDGTWPNARLLHALVPPDLFYRLPEAPQQLALEALGHFRAATAGRVEMTGSETTTTVARVDRLVDGRPLPEPSARDAEGRWNPTFLAVMATVGDPVADAVVREVLGAGDVAAVGDLMMKIVRSDELLPTGLPPVAVQYFARTGTLPTGADPAKILVAQRLFTRCGWGVTTALFASSLPHLYAFPIGARVLRYTQGLTRHAWRRIVETAQFVFDVCDEGSMAPGGRGVPTTQKVRLMHAAIRHLVLQQDSWPAAQGVPISQAQLATTLVTFSSVVLDGLRRMKFEVSHEEAEAWVHLWSVVGAVLGIRADLIPRDEADGDALFSVMAQAQWGASAEGADLTAATIDLMRQLLPGPWLAHLPATLVRYLAGDGCADLLAVPAGDWTRLLLDGASDLEGWIDTGDHDTKIARLVQKASLAIMKGCAGLAREGKGVQFRMPTALIRSWGDGNGPSS